MDLQEQKSLASVIPPKQMFFSLAISMAILIYYSMTLKLSGFQALKINYFRAIKELRMLPSLVLMPLCLPNLEYSYWMFPKKKFEIVIPLLAPEEVKSRSKVHVLSPIASMLLRKKI